MITQYSVHGQPNLREQSHRLQAEKAFKGGAKATSGLAQHKN